MTKPPDGRGRAERIGRGIGIFLAWALLLYGTVVGLHGLLNEAF